MFHNSGDINVLAVADAVDIHLDRVIQVAVNEHRPEQKRLLTRDTHVAEQAGTVVDDLHGPTTEYIGRPHDHRETYPLGNPLGLRGRPRGAVFGLAQTEFLEKGLKPLAI